jgi:Asp/Glu/hydantoin racemase
MADKQNETGTEPMKRGVFKLPRTNKPYFGQAIGILMFENAATTEDIVIPITMQRFTRIPGDVGNASSFPFPVQYKLMKGVLGNEILSSHPTKETEEKVVALARELEDEGVRAIATTCGLMCWFQQVMARAVEIPVFSSSLLQVPVVSRVIGNHRKVGIMTVDSRILTEEHLRRVGIDKSTPFTIHGLEQEGLFVDEVEPLERLKALENVMVPAAQRMVRNDPDIAAIVYECTLMPPTSAAVQEATGLPVFDVITLIKWAYSAVVQRRYNGFV